MDLKYFDEVCYGVYDGCNIFGGKVLLYYYFELEDLYELLKC